MVLMAEASSDNAATHTTEFLHFSVCLVFIGDPHGTPQGRAPSTGSSTEQSSGEFGQTAKSIMASNLGEF